MPLTRLCAEGFGPFEKLDLDLSDGNGNPHLGPHILCGVNGCGKSTALRVIAWLLSSDGDHHNPTWLFSRRRWLAQTHAGLRAIDGAGNSLIRVGGMNSSGSPTIAELSQWAKSVEDMDSPKWSGAGADHHPRSCRLESWRPYVGSLGCIAGYSRTLVLDRQEQRRSQSPDSWKTQSLSFEQTIDASWVTDWWVDAFSKDAIAKTRGLKSQFTKSLERLSLLLSTVTGTDIRPDVEIESVQSYPIVHFQGARLDFSQLPDGVRSILGFAADYFRRLDGFQLETGNEDPPGILLLDEIDPHLHPMWQRRILPALRAALPKVQIICTTHSPFVINSCRDARIHVLKVAEDGTATAEPPINAPFGKSFAATIKDIFDIPTDYDWETERELKQWQELKRKQRQSPLSVDESSRLSYLTDELANRGDELRALVTPVGSLDVDEIIAMLSKSKAS